MSGNEKLKANWKTRAALADIHARKTLGVPHRYAAYELLDARMLNDPERGLFAAWRESLGEVPVVVADEVDHDYSVLFDTAEVEDIDEWRERG